MALVRIRNIGRLNPQARSPCLTQYKQRIPLNALITELFLLHQFYRLMDSRIFKLDDCKVGLK